MNWTLNNVYFDLNTETNQAVGSFTVNRALTAIVDWSIDITGTNPLGVYDYLPSTSFVYSFSPSKILFSNSGSSLL